MGRTVGLRRRWFLLLLLLPLICTGCVNERQDGNAFVYTYESWVSIVVALVGVGCTVGFFLLTEWRGKIACIIGFIFALVFMPDYLLARVTVNEEGFKSRRAMGFYLNEGSYLYKDIKYITIKESVSYSRKRGRSVTHTLQLQKVKDGGIAFEESVTVNELMKKGALDQIIMHAVEKEIPINDQRTQF